MLPTGGDARVPVPTVRRRGSAAGEQPLHQGRERRRGVRSRQRLGSCHIRLRGVGSRRDSARSRPIRQRVRCRRHSAPVRRHTRVPRRHASVRVGRPVPAGAVARLVLVRPACDSSGVRSRKALPYPADGGNSPFGNPSNPGCDRSSCARRCGDSERRRRRHVCLCLDHLLPGHRLFSA